jgi:hypothetical protein
MGGKSSINVACIFLFLANAVLEMKIWIYLSEQSFTGLELVDPGAYREDCK